MFKQNAANRATMQPVQKKLIFLFQLIACASAVYFIKQVESGGNRGNVYRRPHQYCGNIVVYVDPYPFARYSVSAKSPVNRTMPARTTGMMNKKIIFLFNSFLMQCGIRMNNAGTKLSTVNCALRISVETSVESTMLDMKSKKAHVAIRKRRYYNKRWGIRAIKKEGF